MPSVKNNESEALGYKMISPQRTGKNSPTLTPNKLNGTNDLANCTKVMFSQGATLINIGNHSEKTSGWLYLEHTVSLGY